MNHNNNNRDHHDFFAKTKIELTPKSHLSAQNHLLVPPYNDYRPPSKYKLKRSSMCTLAKTEICLFVHIVNHNSGFIIGIAMIFFAKTLIKHAPKSHLRKHPSA